MKDVKELLSKRDTLFEQQTRNVIGHLSPITKGIRDFLTNIDPSYVGGAFVWEDIGMYDDDLLMLMGKVVYPVGCELDLDGQLIVIDAENQDYFSRVLRIGIPINIVNLGEPKPVVEFLSKLHSTTPVLDDPDAVDITKEVEDELNAIEAEARETSKKTPPTDFDLDALSDEQRASLELFKYSK